MTVSINQHSYTPRPVRMRRPATRFDPDSPQFVSSSRRRRKTGPKKVRNIST